MSVVAATNVTPRKESQGAWTKDNGAALKRARKKAGLTALELATRLGLGGNKNPERTVYAWEAGSYGPGRQRALLLVRELNMDAREWGEILGGAEPDGDEWAKFAESPEYAQASPEAIRFVRTQWLPDEAAPTVHWYKYQLASFAMLPRKT